MDNIEGYEDLANAIVKQAADDYREALRRLSGGRRNTEAEQTKRECEQFFLSDWFCALTKLDGEWLLRKLNEEADIS